MDVTLTPRQALEAMTEFLNHFYSQAGDDLVTLLADISIEADGSTLDPAAWDDWINAVETVLARQRTSP
jgi:hypothetical protein